MNRQQQLALGLPLAIVIVTLLMMMAIPALHARRVSTEPILTHKRSVLYASLLSIWDELHKAGVLTLPGVMLDWGTLLGALRNGRLIPWDYDIDLRIPADKICTVYNMLRGSRFRLIPSHIMMTYGAYPTIKLVDTQTGVHADMEPYLVERGRVHRGSYGWVLRRCDWFLPRRWSSHYEFEMLPLRSVLVEGVQVSIPRHAELILEQLYGMDWRTPRIKKHTQSELADVDSSDSPAVGSGPKRV
jgi:hypothetical protein